MVNDVIYPFVLQQIRGKNQSKCENNNYSTYYKNHKQGNTKVNSQHVDIIMKRFSRQSESINVEI